MDNSEDIIDSRDVIARIAELEDEERDEDEEAEYVALVAFAEDGENYIADWTYGEALIRDSYFEEYAEQLAEDIGAIDGNASWPLTFIDWSAAADALQEDYTALDFDGVTYWGR